MNWYTAFTGHRLLRATLAITAPLLFTAGCGEAPSHLETGWRHNSLTRIEPAYEHSQWLLTVPKAKLGADHPYVFGGAAIPAEQQSGFSNKSRLVYFERVGESLLMREELVGNVKSQENPTWINLYSFPILDSIDDTLLLVDLNPGLDKTYTASTDSITDAYGTAYDPENVFEVVQFDDDRSIQSITVSGDGGLTFVQVVSLLEGRRDGKLTSIPLKVNHTLLPYVENPDFVQSDFNFNDPVHYFQSWPLVQPSGFTKISNKKWDLSGERKIRYAISANTPARFRDSVAAGVLYWNHALGEERIEVVNAPEGVWAPSLDHNLIQWVEDRAEVSAFADFSTAPISGEILHAQVYFNSAWQLPPYDDMRPMLRRLSPDTPLTRERLDALSGCFVTATIAHEVGHTLGLRHNFAGNHQTQFANLDDRDAAFAVLAKTGIQDIPADSPVWTAPTSSCMDYMASKDKALVGCFIQHLQEASVPAENLSAFTYDVQALSHLYPEVGGEAPLPSAEFCTDTDAHHLDCVRRSEGKQRPLALAQGILNAIDEMSDTLLWSAVCGATTPDVSERQGVADYDFKKAGANWAKHLVNADFEILLEWFSSRQFITHDLSEMSDHDYTTWLYEQLGEEHGVTMPERLGAVVNPHLGPACGAGAYVASARFADELLDGGTASPFGQALQQAFSQQAKSLGQVVGCDGVTPFELSDQDIKSLEAHFPDAINAAAKALPAALDELIATETRWLSPTDESQSACFTDVAFDLTRRVHTAIQNAEQNWAASSPFPVSEIAGARFQDPEDASGGDLSSVDEVVLRAPFPDALGDLTADEYAALLSRDRFMSAPSWSTDTWNAILSHASEGFAPPPMPERAGTAAVALSPYAVGISSTWEPVGCLSAGTPWPRLEAMEAAFTGVAASDLRHASGFSELRRGFVQSQTPVSEESDLRDAEWFYCSLFQGHPVSFGLLGCEE